MTPSVPAPAGEAPDVKARLDEIRTRYNAVDVTRAPRDDADRVAIASWEDIPELLAMVEDLMERASGAPGRDAPQSDTLVTDEEAKAVREIVQRQDSLNDPYAWHRGIEWLLAERRGGLPAAPPDGPFTGEAPGADLRARIAELEAALAPFANAAAPWDSVPGNEKVTHYRRGNITVGDLRRARTALGKGSA